MIKTQKIFEKNLKKFQKTIDKQKGLCYTNIRRKGKAIAADKRSCWCGSMAEQLICNQQVVGSTPITSSIWERSRVAKGGRL